MMTSWNGNIFRVTGHLCGEFTSPWWIPRTKASAWSFDIFLICVWINDWVNNCEAGDLKSYCTHYDVIVMFWHHCPYKSTGNYSLVNKLVNKQSFHQQFELPWLPCNVTVLLLHMTFSNVFSQNENIWISIKMSPKFIPKGPINNIPALVHIMAWRQTGDKPLSETMVIILLMHICVTLRHQFTLYSHHYWNYLIDAKWRIYASVIQPSLVQIMACPLVGAKPLLEPMLKYC